MPRTPVTTPCLSTYDGDVHPLRHDNWCLTLFLFVEIQEQMACQDITVKTSLSAVDRPHLHFIWWSSRDDIWFYDDIWLCDYMMLSAYLATLFRWFAHLCFGLRRGSITPPGKYCNGSNGLNDLNWTKTKSRTYLYISHDNTMRDSLLAVRNIS